MSDARSEEEYERTEAHGETSRMRRAFLKGGVATSVVAASMLYTWPVFAQTGGEIKPFTYHVPQSSLNDLKRRLANTRGQRGETLSPVLPARCARPRLND
jgi:hypothetical protein